MDVDQKLLNHVKDAKLCVDGHLDTIFFFRFLGLNFLAVFIHVLADKIYHLEDNILCKHCKNWELKGTSQHTLSKHGANVLNDDLQ